jgi:hypothetical protein
MPGKTTEDVVPKAGILDPLDMFGRQRKQTLLIAAADCRRGGFTVRSMRSP